MIIERNHLWTAALCALLNACAFEPATESDIAATEAPIIGGSYVTSPTKYPGMAALNLETSPGNFSHFCGGTLVHKDWILTAAHCFVPAPSGNTTNPADVCVAHPERCWATMGQVDWLASGTTDVQFQEVIIHPNYNSTTQDNDIALVFLSESVDNIPITPLLSKAQFDSLRGKSGSNASIYYTGETSYAVGWGVTRANGVVGDESDIVGGTRLKETTALEYIGYGTQCNAWSRYDEHVPRITITANQLCAGTTASGSHGTLTDGSTTLARSASDACYGDSGGPLFLALPQGGYAQIGITSFGLGCAARDYPGIYTRVGNYIDSFIMPRIVERTNAVLPIRYGSNIVLNSYTDGNLRRESNNVLKATSSSASTFQICKVNSSNAISCAVGGVRVGDTVVVRIVEQPAFIDPWDPDPPTYRYVSDSGTGLTVVTSTTYNSVARWRVVGAGSQANGTYVEAVGGFRVKLENASSLERIKVRDAGQTIVAVTGSGGNSEWTIEQREYRSWLEGWD